MRRAGDAGVPQDRQLTLQHLAAQRLSGPPLSSPYDVASHLLAVQGQDPRGFRLAVRARTSGLCASDVDAALASGSLVVGWLNRGTLHLVAREDYWWLHALTTPQLASTSARRLEQEGVSPSDAERAVALLERTLVDDGPQTRAQLRERIDAIGVRTERQAMVHILFLASLRGVCVRGPVVEGLEQGWAHAPTWLGPAPAVDRDAALRELIVRYLRGHAPASEADLARWAKVPLRAVRRGLSLASSVVDVDDRGLMSLRRESLSEELPPPRLLGAFDPVLLGWASRDDIVGGYSRIVTDNGVFRPFLLVDGRAVGLWRWERGRVTSEPLEPLDRGVVAALEADAADVTRFLSSSER